MRSSSGIRLSTAGVASIAIGVLSIDETYAASKECMAAASTGQEVRDQGHFVESREYFQRCAQSDCPAPIPTYCAEWLNDVGKKIPTLVIRVVDDLNRDITDADVALDGRAFNVDGRSVEVDPGRHLLRIARPGMKPFEMEIVAAQGEKDRIVLGRLVAEVPPPPPAPAPKIVPPPRQSKASVFHAAPTASWIAWGIGAAGLISFSAFGLKARLDYDSYESSCGQRCSASDRDSVATTVRVADVSLVVGLLSAGIGTALFFVQPKVSADVPPPRKTGGVR